MRQLYCEKCSSKFIAGLELCLFCPYGEREFGKEIFLCNLTSKKRAFLSEDKNTLIIVSKRFKQKSLNQGYSLEGMYKVWSRTLYKELDGFTGKKTKKLFNALLTFLTGSWEKAMKMYQLAGKLRKRLMIPKADFRKLAVALALKFPYAEKDAKNCPSVLRSKLITVLGLGSAGTNKPEWLGGIKFIYHAFPKPKLCNWTPRTRNDVKVAELLYEVEIYRSYYETERLEVDLLRKYSKKLIPIRNQIGKLNKGWINEMKDACRMEAWLITNNTETPKFDPYNIHKWHNDITELYTTEQEKFMDAEKKQKMEALLPGKDLIPEIEHERMQKGRDLVVAGKELGHCVGSYYDSESYIHYRRGNVICQIAIIIDSRKNESSYSITQCYDSHNRLTKEATEYREEVSKYLFRLSKKKEDTPRNDNIEFGEQLDF